VRRPNKHPVAERGKDVLGAVVDWILTRAQNCSTAAEMGDPLATIDMGRKVGAAMPLYVGAGSPSNTMSPRPRPISVPSGILIHPTVWPQYVRPTDRTTVP